MNKYSDQQTYCTVCGDPHETETIIGTVPAYTMRGGSTSTTGYVDAYPQGECYGCTNPPADTAPQTADRYLVSYPDGLGFTTDLVDFRGLTDLFRFSDSDDHEPAADALACVLHGQRYDVTISRTIDHNDHEV